jgi:hypothetical protein|nr:MAG TPA: hypothetical protein [Caudoviricetes sp.]DAV62213.1 MAG TPA: hypothetical protein [Caudoviricetes sp.]
MLDKAEIRAAIAKLEFDESSYSNYAKLASLYVIRDKMQEEERGDGGRYLGYYSGAPAPVTAEPATVGEYGDSEFLLAVAGKDQAKAWTVVDELMDTLSLVNRRVYDSVLRKMKSL